MRPSGPSLFEALKDPLAEAQRALETIRTHGFEPEAYDEAAGKWVLSDNTVSDTKRAVGGEGRTSLPLPVKDALAVLNRLPFNEANDLINGAAQPTLPGTEEVRTVEAPTPEVAEAPFALTSPTAKPGKAAPQKSLFEEPSGKPRFSQRQPVFYSTLTRAAEQLPQAKGTPEQMSAMLAKAKGVKAEELAWSGVLPWLKGLEGSVTKQQIVDYLRASELQVKETVLGAAGNTAERARLMNVITGNGFRIEGGIDIDNPDAEPRLVDTSEDPQDEEYYVGVFGGPYADSVPQDVRDAFEAWRELEIEEHPTATQYATYQLGGPREGYRELLLQLPERPPPEVEPPGFNVDLISSDEVDPVYEINFADWNRPGRNLAGSVSFGPATGRLPDEWRARFQNQNLYVSVTEERDSEASKDLAIDWVKRQMSIVWPTIAENQQRGATFHPGHFVDYRNLLLHIRFNSRVDADGKRVLLIEEIQSDWHQKAREARKADIKRLVAAGMTPAEAQKEAISGYADDSFGRQMEEYTRKRRELVERSNDLLEPVNEILLSVDRLGFDFVSEARAAARENPDWADRWDVRSTLTPEQIATVEQYSVVGRELTALRTRLPVHQSSLAPDAPLKTTWHELALKRMVRWAAEQGYDRLAWTTGTQQVARYQDEFRKIVDTIRWMPGGQWGKDYRVVHGLKGNGVVFSGVVGPDGTIEQSNVSAAVGAPIEKAIGKPIAARVLAEGRGEVTGKDLTIGGEGLKGFYDKMLRDYLQRFGKPFGATVGSTTIAVGAMPLPTDERWTVAQVTDMPGYFLLLGTTFDYERFETRNDAQLEAGGRNRNLNERKVETDQVHSMDITPTMAATAAQGFPLFRHNPLESPAKNIAPGLLDAALDQRRLQKETYANIPMLTIGDRQVPVIDAGQRLHRVELEGIFAKPGVQRVALAALDVLDDAIDKLLGANAAYIEARGIILHDITLGAYMPNVWKKPSEQAAKIVLNFFESMYGEDGQITSPQEAADVVFQTIVHEIAHWDIPGEGAELDDAIAERMARLGDDYQDAAVAKIRSAYEDPGNPGSFDPDLTDALSVYSESRRRPEVAPDSYSGTGRYSQRRPDDAAREGAAPGPTEPSRRTVTLSEHSAQILGLSDVGRYPELTRKYVRGGIRFTGPADAIRDLITEMKDRATEGEGGYGEENVDKAALLKNLSKIRLQGETGAVNLEALTPAVQKVAEIATNERNLFTSFLTPARVGVAPIAAGNIRAQTSANDQRKGRIERSFRSLRRRMDWWGEKQSLDFMDVMEGLKPVAVLAPEWQAVAQQYRDTLEKWKNVLIDNDLLENYLENYWPHEWKPETVEGQKIRKWFGRRPIQGPEAYRHKRVFPTTRDGLAAGFVPMSMNPTEQLLRKVFEMSQSMKGRLLHDDMKKSGLYQFVSATKSPAPEIRHWKRVPEYALGTVYGPRVEEQKFGRVVAGHYYAPPEVVKLIENHLSPGLYGRSFIYDGFKALGNLTTNILLGWSTFHMWMTGIEAMISKGSLALELAARGELKEAAKQAAWTASYPIGVGLARDLYRGHQAIKEFYARDADANEVSGILGQIVQGGGGVGWSLFEHQNAPEKFLANLAGLLGAFERREVGTAAVKGAKATIYGAQAVFELPTKIIMEQWVPYLKVSAYLDAVQMEQRRLGPQATLSETRKVFGDVWDAMDDRFGQLRYDNLFWDNAFKQSLTGAFLSVGWNLGSLRHGIGALGQIGRSLENVKAKVSGGGRPGPPGIPSRRWKPGGTPLPGERVMQPQLQRNMAWLISGAVIIGMAGAIWQYLPHRQAPGGLERPVQPAQRAYRAGRARRAGPDDQLREGLLRLDASSGLDARAQAQAVPVDVVGMGAQRELLRDANLRPGRPRPQGSGRALGGHRPALRPNRVPERQRPGRRGRQPRRAVHRVPEAAGDSVQAGARGNGADQGRGVTARLPAGAGRVGGADARAGRGSPAAAGDSGRGAAG